jgi:HD superfamily phosphodiesterase
MNTKEGKRLAKIRHEFILNYLQEFFLEWDVKVDDEI